MNMRTGLTVVTRLVAGAVLRSIEGDLPEIIVSRYPIGPVLALSALSPRLGDWIIARMAVNDFFRRAQSSVL